MSLFQESCPVRYRSNHLIHLRRRVVLASFVMSMVIATLPAQQIERPAEPASAPTSEANDVIESIHACAYRGVVPGESTKAAAVELLGQPSSDSVENGGGILVYQQEPFQKVELFIEHDAVVSIVLHMKEPAPAQQIVSELQLDGFTAASVLSEEGMVLGRAYPERGVLLNYGPDQPPKVTQLVLEPVSAELFVLRVEQDRLHRYEQDLADLETALEIDPSRADALYWKARILAAAGKPTSALTIVEQAVQLAPSHGPSRLLRIELLARLERQEEAGTLARDIAGDPLSSPLHRARAEFLLGEVLSRGPDRDYRRAIERHLQAIKLLTPLASDRSAAIRRDAKVQLIDAFLASAHDIAAGKWQRRDETAARWLASARELSDALVANDQGDAELKLRVLLATIQAHADMQSDVDPAQLLASIDREITRLSEASGDPLFQQALTMHRLQALFDAAGIEQGREANLKAREYALQAAELVDSLLKDRELIPAERLQLGRLYFFIGSSHAVVDQKHDLAMKWYTKAQEYLTDALPPSARQEQGRFGERLVSMGASAWETGDRDEGLDLTRRGLEMMKQAAKRDLIDEKQLILPYENLAAMYRILGDEEESRNWAEMAAQVSEGSRRIATQRR